MVSEGRIPGVLLLQDAFVSDARGYFRELWQRRRFTEAGVPEDFVQDNVSVSEHGVLRGLHLQHPSEQGKLISAAHGEVYDVAVDVRRGSPMFGRWEAFRLSPESGLQVYLPEGIAHGLLVLSERAVLCYKCTQYWAPEAELAINWNDPDLAIDWPFSPSVVSAKDANAPRLRDIPPHRLPLFAGSRPGFSLEAAALRPPA